MDSPSAQHPASLDSVSSINDAPSSSADSGANATKTGLAVYWSVVKKVMLLLPFCLALAIAGGFVGPLQNGIRIKFYAPTDVYNATDGCNGRTSPIQPLPQACIDAQNTNERTSGILTAAGAVTQFFLLPVLGKASDAYGRRPLAIFSCVCMLIDSGTLLFTQLTGASLYIYFAAEFIGGFAAFNVVFLSVMADKTTNEERGIAFAVIFGLLGLSSLVALSVVASIGDTISQVR
jgi:MFS family permease